MTVSPFFDAWAPVFALVPDGTRTVLQVSWTGGSGNAPSPNGYYLGATGYVASIADAVAVSVSLRDGSSVQDSQFASWFHGATTPNGGGGFLASHNNAADALPNTNDRLGYFYGGSVDAGANRNAAGMSLQASENWVSGTSSGAKLILEVCATGQLNRAQAMVLGSGGAPYFPLIPTTASAANAVIADGAVAGALLKSTSSIIYKSDVEDLDPAAADAVVSNLRPIWYRSKADADRKDWSWYGLIAEEAAKVDPRLVHYDYPPDAWEEKITETSNGSVSSKVLKDGSEKVPSGIAYDRLSVMLLSVVKRMEQRIAALEKAGS